VGILQGREIISVPSLGMGKNFPEREAHLSIIDHIYMLDPEEDPYWIW
jgi:hypothetical protein